MDEISQFNSGLEITARASCETIRTLIDDELGSDCAKLYHGAPVWFVDGNPIVGYSVKKNGVAVLFWSGQSFTGPGLRPVGKYKAAELLVPERATLPLDRLKMWLTESKTVIWDYKNMPKRKGVLEML